MVCAAGIWALTRLLGPTWPLMQTLLAKAWLPFPTGYAQGPCQKASCPHLLTSPTSQQPLICTPCLQPSGCSKPGSECTRCWCTLSKKQGAPTCLVQCTRLFSTRSSTSGVRIQYKFSQNTQGLWSFAPTATRQPLLWQLSQNPHASTVREVRRPTLLVLSEFKQLEGTYPWR